MSEFLFALLGLGVGAALAWFYANSRSGAVLGAAEELKKQLSAAQTDRETAQQTADREREARIKAQAELDAARERLEESQKLLEQTKKELRLEFENLANRIFDDKSKKFSDLNKTSVDALLKPLREQIRDFAKRVNEVYHDEAKERSSLKTQIEQLTELNRTMREEAVNLTNALKGQSKTLGNWGEVVLARIFEQSGLHEGREYTLQETERTEEGKVRFLDAIVQLPEGKQVIVDAKASLTAYEQYSSATTDEERETALAAHLTAVRNHIKELSNKDYHDLPGVESLDFVLMFIPIEGAFMLALEHGHAMFQQAFRENIMLVSPSTLLLSLRIIANLWRYQRQNENAERIAERAGKLYDKFSGFVDDMEKIGRQLGTVQGTHRDAMTKLSEGRGNLIRRAEQLREMGAKTAKQLPEHMVNRSGSEFLFPMFAENGEPDDEQDDAPDEDVEEEEESAENPF